MEYIFPDYKSFIKCLSKGWVILLFLCYETVLGQLQITYPTSRMVIQRNNANQSVIYIAGNYSQYIDSVQARMVARPFTPAQGTTTSWNTIQTNLTGGVFYGSMIVTGGWYDLELRGYFEGQLATSISVERIGVGEVFVIAGQSNASGDLTLAASGNYGLGSNDDRVSSVNYNKEPTESYHNSVIPSLPFTHLEYNTLLAPFGVGAWSWGALGDTLVHKLNVPIAFFNAAWSGSPVHSWSESANDTSATPAALFGWFNYPAGMPYGNLRLTLNNYAAQYGVRAVLWHQGESDNWEETTRDNYGAWLKNVIEKSRLHSGKPNLTWVVAKATRVKGYQAVNSRIWQPVIDAQKDVSGANIGSPNYVANVVEGPSTDELVGPNIRTMPDSIHFFENGHRIHAGAWSNVLNANFFNTVTPYLPEPLPRISAECATNTALRLTSANAYDEYIWTNNSTATYGIGTANQIIIGVGNYILRVKNSAGNILFSPSVQVPSSFSGIIPISSAATGTWFDTNTWVCGRIPTSLDYVNILPAHTVTIPANNNGNFRKLIMTGGNINFQSQAVLSK